MKRKILCYYQAQPSVYVHEYVTMGKKKFVLLHVPWFHFRTTQDYPDVRNTRQQIFIFGKAPSPWITENWKSDTQQSIIPRVPFDYTKHFGIKKG